MKFWALFKEIIRIIWLSFALNALLYFASCAYNSSGLSISFIATAGLICFELGWVFLLAPRWLAYICKLNDREATAEQILRNSPKICLHFANRLAPGSSSKCWRSARIANIVVVLVFIAATSIYLLKVSQLSKKINADYDAGRYAAAHSYVDELSQLKRSVLGPLAAAAPYRAHADRTFFPVKKRIIGEAEWGFQRSIPALRHALPEADAQLERDLSSLAELKMAKGEIAEAKLLFEEAIKIESDAKRKNNDISDIYIGLAQCELCEKNYAAASKLYQTALEALRENYGDNSEYTIRCRLEFAEVEIKSKNLAKAEALSSAAVKAAMNLFDRDLKAQGYLLSDTYRQLCASLSIQEQVLREENKDKEADLVKKESIAIDKRRQDINKIDRGALLRMNDRLQDLALWLLSIKYGSKDAKQAKLKLQPYLQGSANDNFDAMLWGPLESLKPEKPVDYTDPDFSDTSVETTNSTREIDVSVRGTIKVAGYPKYFGFRYIVSIDPKNSDGFNLLRIQQLIKEDIKNL